MKDNVWVGMGISVATEALIVLLAVVSQMFLSNGLLLRNIFVYVFFADVVALFVWGMILVIKYNKNKLGFGMITGLFIPPVAVGIGAVLLQILSNHLLK